MSNLQDQFAAIVEEFEGMSFPGDVGTREPFSFLPPCDESVVEVYEDKLGHPLPPDLAAFADVTRGFDGNELHLEHMRLPETPRRVGLHGKDGPWFGLRNAIQFGHDGFGNYGYIEVGREHCRVWYHCHDPASLVLLGRSLLDFFERRLEVCRRGKRAVEARVESTPGEGQDAEQTVDEPGIPEHDYTEIEAMPVEQVDTEGLGEETAELLRTMPESSRAIDFRGRDIPVGYRWAPVGCMPNLGDLLHRMTFGLFGSERSDDAAARTAKWMKFGELLLWIPHRAIQTLRDSDAPADRDLLDKIDYEHREVPGPPPNRGCLA